MPGLAKLGSIEFQHLQTVGHFQSRYRSNLTEALKWPKAPAAFHHSGRPNPRRIVDHSLNSDDNCSEESDNDLASMVRDFLESDNSGHDGSCYSSDSDSGTAGKFSEKIKSLKIQETSFEKDLLTLVHRIILTREFDMQCGGEGNCTSSCITRYLVKFLNFTGCKAALRYTKWKGTDKVPGGEYEYIEVAFERDYKIESLIVDIDFKSHFEIARPTSSYVGILSSLPTVYVGGSEKLDQILELMVDAAKLSLKQNLMPLPPWRTLGYLRAKWFSPCENEWNDNDKCFKTCFDQGLSSISHSKCVQCFKQWKRLRSSVRSEIDVPSAGKPSPNDANRKVQIERRSKMPKVNEK